jgi:pseudouridine-5'-phosphate glycosidase
MTQAANELLLFTEEVRAGLLSKTPVVAIESAAIVHGIDRPGNYELALELEESIRAQGAIPALIAVLDGNVYIGMHPDQIRTLTLNPEVMRVGSRDLAIAVTFGKSAATTAEATIELAKAAGITTVATFEFGDEDSQSLRSEKIRKAVDKATDSAGRSTDS